MNSSTPSKATLASGPATLGSGHVPTSFKEAWAQRNARRSPLARAIAQYHAAIPRRVVPAWLANAQQFMKGFECASGCSGTDIWLKGLAEMLDFWQSEFGVGLGEDGLRSLFVAENDISRQNFLTEQFQVSLLIADVEQFGNARCWNEITSASEHTPWPSVFGAGISCKPHSRENNNRKKNKGCIAAGELSAGHTFKYVLAFLKKARPKISFLETVPGVEQEVEDEDGAIGESDAQYMQRELEGAGFEVIRTTFSARLYGSPAERVRWWLVVFDLAASVNPYVRATVREQFFTVFDNIKISSEALPIEDMFLFACGHDV